MKKYLGLLLLLVSFTSFGQFSNYTNINGRYKWIAGKFDSTFTIPSGTTPSLRVGGGTGPGALFYSTTDSTVYQYTGTRWTRLRGTDTAHVVSAYVRNTTASTMTSGQVVYINGSTGTTPTIALAVNTADSTSAMTFGFVRGTIAPNAFGWITTFGPLEGVNTNAYTEGEVIYLDSIPGQFTHDKPQAPYHMVTLGYIVKKSGGNGTIFAKIQNGYELEELHNVRITSPVRNNGILAYDSVAQLWKDTTLSAIGGVTGSGTSGQVSYWTGTSSQSGSNNLFWDNANGRLGIGTNTPNGIWSGNNRAIQILSPSNFSSELILSRPVGSTAAASVSTFLSASTNVYGFYTASSDLSFVVYTTNLERFRVNNNGNFLINSTTDGGQRLQVTGDVLFKGSGNTSGTTALTVQNSDGTNRLRVRNDGYVMINGDLWIDDDFRRIFAGSGRATVSRTSTGTSTIFYNAFQLTNNNAAWSLYSDAAQTITSGSINGLFVRNNFAPTSGTATFSNEILTIINQTGGANGITRGLYVNPTLTAAADWRSIEWSNNSGWGLYGAGTANNYLAGNLSVGTTGTTAGYFIRSHSGIYAGGNLRFDGGVRDNRDNTIISQSASTEAGARLLTIGNATYQRVVIENPNLLLGSTVDGGQKLQVTGNAIVTGSAVASTALLVRNSTPANVFAVRGDAQITIGASASFGIANSVFNDFNPSNHILGFSSPSTWATNGIGYWFYDRSATSTSSNLVQVRIGGISTQSFAPTSGTATHTTLQINATINQTGGANGITRGLYIQPTLTAAADWRSLEWSNNTGKGIWGVGTADNAMAGSLTVGAASSANASAILELSSTTKGFLPPKMTGTEAEAIASPATGLLVFITNGNGTTITSTGWWGYESAGWVKLN